MWIGKAGQTNNVQVAPFNLAAGRNSQRQGPAPGDQAQLAPRGHLSPRAGRADDACPGG